MPFPVRACPSGFVTVTFWAPDEAPTVERFSVICVGVANVTLFTFTPPVTDAVM
jgi:hypothetical protein